jgi:hypothetical protein
MSSQIMTKIVLKKIGNHVQYSGVHWLSDMVENTDQNNQVLTVLWRQYLYGLSYLII